MFSAVAPRLVCRLMSAPRFRRSSTICACPCCAASISRVHGAILPASEGNSARVSAFPPSFSHNRTGPTWLSAAAIRTFFGTSPPGALPADGGGVRSAAEAREGGAGMTSLRKRGQAGGKIVRFLL